MSLTLESSDGTVAIEELPGERRQLSIALKDKNAFALYRECVTTYPIELIKFMLNAHGAIGLCYEIMRDQDPNAVERLLRNDLFAYFKPEDFDGKEILEFGCGSGASTAILARMFPTAKITGVELYPQALAVARKRLEFHKRSDVKLLLSPSGLELPASIGEYDFVIMSAVYEHLLPAERPVIMSKLWSVVRENGALFLNQTPNLWFPFELHTTLLPLINYLPDKLTHRITRRFSKRVPPSDTWEQLLRKGIRGGTVAEVMRMIPPKMGKPVLLEPKNNGLKDRIDLYYLNTNPNKHKTAKQIAKFGMKTIRAASGAAIVPDLSLAIRKRSES